MYANSAMAMVFADMGSGNTDAHLAAVESGMIDYVDTESEMIDAQNARITLAPLMDAQNIVVNILAHGL